MAEPQQGGKPKSLAGRISDAFHRKKEDKTPPEKVKLPEGTDLEQILTGLSDSGLEEFPEAGGPQGVSEFGPPLLSDLDTADLVVGLSLINVFERFGANLTASERRAMVAVIRERCPWYFEPVPEAAEYRDRGNLRDMQQALDLIARIEQQGRPQDGIAPRGAGAVQGRAMPRRPRAATINAESVDQLRALVEEFDRRTGNLPGGSPGKKGIRTTFG
jgi:hypothetical protein